MLFAQKRKQKSKLLQVFTMTPKVSFDKLIKLNCQLKNRKIQAQYKNRHKNIGKFYENKFHYVSIESEKNQRFEIRKGNRVNLKNAFYRGLIISIFNVIVVASLTDFSSYKPLTVFWDKRVHSVSFSETSKTSFFAKFLQVKRFNLRKHG